jgi:hypothetical protein
MVSPALEQLAAERAGKLRGAAMSGQLSEGLPLLRVAHGLRHRTLQPLLRELRHHLRVTLTFPLFEQIRHRDPDIGEVQFGCVGPVLTHLVELAAIYHAWLVQAREAVALALRQGQSDGSVKPDIDARQSAQAAVDATTGPVFRWCLSPEQVDLEAELETWAAIAKQNFGV